MEVPLPVMAGPGDVPLPLPDAGPGQARVLERRLREAAAGFPSERTTVRTVHGWPVRALLERAEGAGLVVMGTHGYAGLDRALLGSVAEAVVRASRTPVLTVRESRTPLKIARILAPWNGTPYATSALRYARVLAGSLGAELRVLRVVPAGYSIRRSRHGQWRRLETLLDGAEWSLRVRVGEAREQILQEANSGRYGLLVLSAHRRRFSTDVVLGSTVERALRHSLIPVLSFPSGPRSGL